MRLRRNELAKVGIEIVNKNTAMLKCVKCGSTFSPMLKEGGKLPWAFWRCPNGCNPTSARRTCAVCGKPYDGLQRRAYCSDACKQKAYRSRMKDDQNRSTMAA